MKFKIFLYIYIFDIQFIRTFRLFPKRAKDDCLSRRQPDGHAAAWTGNTAITFNSSCPVISS